jgi:hypothetical protein
MAANRLNLDGAVRAEARTQKRCRRIHADAGRGARVEASRPQRSTRE